MGFAVTFARASSVKRRVHGEEALQRAVFQWIFYSEIIYPILRYAIHVPNGGGRSRAEGGALKACGVRSGVPDILIPVRNGVYAGLALELKFGKNRTTEDQDRWLNALANAGYLVGVSYSVDKAIELISTFLKSPPPCNTTPTETRRVDG